MTRAIIIHIFLLLALSACDHAHLQKHDKEVRQYESIATDEAINAGESYLLSEQQLKEAHEKRYNKGGEYAFSIYMHMSMGWSNKNILPKEPRYWLDLAAEQGHYSAIQFRSFSDLNKASPESCHRVLNEIRDIENINPELYEYLMSSLDATKIENCEQLLL
jgi:hypothetical protein